MIRTFAIQALRQTGAKSLKAKMEQWLDCPHKLAETLLALVFFLNNVFVKKQFPIIFFFSGLYQPSL